MYFVDNIKGPIRTITLLMLAAMHCAWAVSITYWGDKQKSLFLDTCARKIRILTHLQQSKKANMSYHYFDYILH